jgi:hypothetical protein
MGGLINRVADNWRPLFARTPAELWDCSIVQHIAVARSQQQGPPKLAAKIIFQKAKLRKKSRIRSVVCCLGATIPAFSPRS